MKINPSSGEGIKIAELLMDKFAQFDFACTRTDQITMTDKVDGRHATLFFKRKQQGVGPSSRVPTKLVPVKLGPSKLDPALRLR